jgi:hypothetical protein
MATKRKAAGADMVTVMCKLPQGLHIHLASGAEVKLHGSTGHYAIMGHGRTLVRADQWSQVEAEYGDAKWLKAEHVFALPDPESAADKAEERKEIDAGFNPIDPNEPNAKVRSGVNMTRAD